MSAQERAWVLKFSVLVGLVLTVPYLLAFRAQGTDWVFSGFLFGVQDGNSYIAKMMQGSAGAWLFRSPYSTVDQAGVLAFLPYLLLGKLAAGQALHEQLVGLYHLFRLAATVVVAFGTYRLAAEYLSEANDRRWVTAVAVLGGGLGWLIALLQPPGHWLGSLPLDFISPESFGFLAVFGLPHLAIARGLGLLGLVVYLAAHRDGQWGWRAGLALLLTALFQPITAVTFCLLIAMHQLALAGKYLGHASAREWLAGLRAPVGAAAVVSPYLIYLSYRFSVDPYLATWTEQNRILSPHPAHYLAAYLILLPAALWGLLLLARRGRDRDLLPVVWAILFPVLAYAPHPVQRRLPEGIWVVLAVAAALAIRSWIQSERGRMAARGLVFAALLPTSAVLYLGASLTANLTHPPTFLPVEQVQAYRWIRGHSPPGAAVLASFETSNALPAYAPVQVPIGHGPESANLEELRIQVEGIFTESLDPERVVEFLTQHGIDLLLAGPPEQALSGSHSPPPYPDLWELKYDGSGWEIYRHRDSSGVDSE